MVDITFMFLWRTGNNELMMPLLCVERYRKREGETDAAVQLQDRLCQWLKKLAARESAEMLRVKLTPM